MRVENYIENELVRLIFATIAVLVLGAIIGYTVRRSGLDRRLKAPVCILIIIPAWIVLGLFHLALWKRVAVILILYPGAILCAGTSIGRAIAESLEHRRNGSNRNTAESE